MNLTVDASIGAIHVQTRQGKRKLLYRDERIMKFDVLFLFSSILFL